jgi:hypothetical protein
MAIERVGKDAPKVIECVIVGIGKGARTVIVRTPQGVQETVQQCALEIIL